MTYVALPTKNPGDILTSALWNTYLQGNADAGFMRMLADQTLGVATASIDFTSIPATFAHLLLVCYLRTDEAVTFGNSGLRFNNDTAANYDWQTSFASAAAQTDAEFFAQTSISAASAGGSAAANLFSTTEILIPHYTGTANNKTCAIVSSLKAGTTTGLMRAQNVAGFWRSNAAINRLTLICGGNFVAGSRVTVYGMPQ